MAYPVETRTQVEVAAACGMTVKEIVESFGVSRATVYCWLNPGRHERGKAAAKRWREGNPTRAKDAYRRWYYSNHDRARGFGRESMKKWRENNPEKAKIRDAKSYRQQYEANREAFIRKALVRKGRMKSFPMTEIERLMCRYYYEDAKQLTEETGIPHEVDHIWPISKGGPHLPWNLRVITRRENKRKGNNI